jgi:hypothetical protein
MQRWRPPERWRYAKGQRHVSLNRDCVVLTRDQLLELQRVNTGINPAESASAEQSEHECAFAELQAIGEKRAEAAAEVERLAAELADAKEGRGSGGLAMTVQLRRLMRDHNIRLDAKPLPLAVPCEANSLRRKGYASTPDIDESRTCFRAGCFGVIDKSAVKLLLKHDPSIVAGSIEQLEVDARGRLVAICTVTHPLGMRMPAFSIGVAVRKCTIRNPDSVSFYADVEEAVLEEISLVDQPANRKAIVTERWIPSAVELSNEALIARVKAVQATVAALHAKGAFASVAA